MYFRLFKNKHNNRIFRNNTHFIKILFRNNVYSEERKNEVNFN